MTETFQCGDAGALVGYLYDECEPAEREAIRAHLAMCADCRAELEALGRTRHHLSVWAPPETRLGIRITDERPETVVDATAAFRARGPGGEGSRAPAAAWWRQPLPAWAQAAAAVLIFAAGVAIGGGRAVADSPAVSSTAGAGRTDAAALQRSVAALERRLAGVEQVVDARAVDAAATPAADTADHTQLMHRVRQEIAASEERQQRQLALRLWQLIDEQSQQQQYTSEQLEVNLRRDMTALVRANLSR